MLPTELLMFKVRAGLVTPRRLKVTPANVALAGQVIATFEDNVGKRRADLDEDLRALEAGRADFKVLRGLAHLLTNGSSTFGTGGDVPPAAVRARVFALAQSGPPSRHRRGQILEQAAAALTRERPLAAADVAELLYADLPDQQRLEAFEPPSPEDLLRRFDLAQAQGMLYRAYSLVITARRNEPARYKQLLQYTKFFGLMLTVEGDATFGFTLTMDGPTSLFGGTTRYGLAMAKFLPALLHATRWDLTASLKPRRDLSWTGKAEAEWLFELTSEDGYVSHYREPDEHDSALVEIVGYWRPEYLRKKFDLLRKSDRTDVIVCVSERLNLERAGVDPSDFGERLIWFKGVLPPKEVLVLAEQLSGGPTEHIS